jgi:cytochrome c-type biogenesis protein CcmF
MSLGSLLIIFSLLVSLISLIFLARSARGNNFAKITSQRLFYLSGISITFAVILLFSAFLSNSFQYTYVYNYSSKELSIFYLIAGFWAGQEGTFLLWVLLLYIFGFVIIRSDDEYENIIISVITITQIFILIILSIPDFGPFRYIWDSYPGHFKQGIIPENGSGLNPLLQNPWMIAHPPVLFIGYASATIPFAYAISGLLKKDFTSWIKRSYKWVLFCMVTLGIGIFLGAYWAYTVLGWGGYWGWDPVENSSLIPWLTIVALMHGLTIQMRKGVLIKTNILLSLISFILVFYSTFLTRSGVLSDFSVHSFSDLGISGPLIFFISFFIVIGAFLFIKGMRDMSSKQLGDRIFIPDNLMSFGIIVLCFYAFFILIGTSMPILSKVFLSKPTTVKEVFYNNLSIPFGISILVLIAVSTMLLSSKKIETKSNIIISAVSLVFGIIFNILHTKNVFAYVFTVLAL